jgi:hypothetical protein
MHRHVTTLVIAILVIAFGDCLVPTASASPEAAARSGIESQSKKNGLTMVAQYSPCPSGNCRR